MNNDELDPNEEKEEQEENSLNLEQAKDEVNDKLDKAKRAKDIAKKAQKVQKNVEKAKTVKAATKLASGAKSFALLANPYFWIALLVILAIIVLIGIIMSFSIMPSNFLGKTKQFVDGMMRTFCGWIWGDYNTPIGNNSEEVKDLANYIQNMGYDIQGYGFGDVEYTKNTQDDQKKSQENTNGIRQNAIEGKRNYVTDGQATQGGEIKKVYGLTAVTTVSNTEYEDGDEMFRISGRFSSKNNDYLRAYLSAEAATYTEAKYSIKGYFNELGDILSRTLDDIFGRHSSNDWDDPGDVGMKAKSTGMLNFTNSGGNNIFNSTKDGSPTRIKIDVKNKKLLLYEKGLNLGLFKIQWGQTFSVDLSNWTAIYGRPLELFLSLHLSSMMPDLPYQIAVDQAFNTKVNINLEDVKMYFETTIAIDGHSVTIGGVGEGSTSSTGGGSGNINGTYISTPQKLGDSWRLTAYADNPSDQGKYVGQFAGSDVAGTGVPGRTIAIAQDVMAKYGLQFGDIIRIDGNDYILNDHGGGEMAGKDAIDIFTTEDHEYEEAYNHNTSEVYLVGHNANSEGLSPVSGKIDLSEYLDKNAQRKAENYDAIKNGDTTLTLVDDNGNSFTATLPEEVLKDLKKLVETGTKGTSVKWPNIESVTNHWYYHIIDFYGTVGKDTPYGAYKKAKVAKKTIKYSDEESGLDGYDIEITALLTSENGIYYQVCEPYLNEKPSIYLKKVFHGAYYKYDGTTETARKIAAARAIEAKYGTDDYNDKDFEKNPQKIVDKKIKYNWHSNDSDTSKLTITLEDATEYVSAKEAQLKVQKKSNALLKIDEETENGNSDQSEAKDTIKTIEEIDEENGGHLEFDGLGEESPMCKKLVDFKSNKSNTLEAFSILENVNSEAADVNYRLLKKLMVEMDYFTEDDMNSHEKNTLLWITNVEGTKGADVAAKINKNLGQTDDSKHKTISDTSRDANEYGVIVSNFMKNTQIVAPGDAKVKNVGSDDHGDYIELEFTTFTDDKVYPLPGTMMLLHQDDERHPLYNHESPYATEPLYSAAEVMRRYRFRDTYQVFEDDDVVGITMRISGLHDIKAKAGDTVYRGEEIARSPETSTSEEEDSGDKIYISMKRADKTKIENVEDYIDPVYTYEDEKNMAKELWYLDHPEYGNRYNANEKLNVDYVEWALQQAQNSAIGYCQTHRFYTDNDNGCLDVDCSSFVYYALLNNNYDVKKYSPEPFCTADGEQETLISLGFTEMDFPGPDKCQKGDILWKDGHTEIYSGNGKSVGAHGADDLPGGHPSGDTGKLATDGDQSGGEVSEITCSSNWTKIYRPPN